MKGPLIPPATLFKRGAAVRLVRHEGDKALATSSRFRK
jgi:hypothetical protein